MVLRIIPDLCPEEESVASSDKSYMDNVDLNDNEFDLDLDALE